MVIGRAFAGWERLRRNDRANLAEASRPAFPLDADEVIEWRSQSELWRMNGMTKPDTPFPKHWLYYITLKYVVIAAAVLIALYVASQLL
jgi:hypothetical protein